jgi:hypothetical protein
MVVVRAMLVRDLGAAPDQTDKLLDQYGRVEQFNLAGI